MTLNFVAKVASKNLGQAMMMRDLQGMRDAFETGADVNMLDVQFPGEDEHFHHPLEIALTCALPLEGFKLLVQHGARMENMDGGLSSVEELFASLPPDMKTHWPDMEKIYNYLKTDETVNSPLPLSPEGLSSKVKDVGVAAKDGFTQAFRDAGTVVKAPVKGVQALGNKASGLLGKFKKS